MKKYLLMLATAVVALGFASCSNEEEDETPAPKSEIKLNISVSNLDGGNDVNGGVSTKAAKTGWVNGDKIMIWYTGNKNQQYPDLVIQYNGSAWNIDKETTVSGNMPKESGTMGAAYMSVYPSRYKYDMNSDWYYAPYAWNNTNVCMPLCISSDMISYTYSDNVLSANINHWRFNTTFKVLIKNDNGNMTKDADHYCLEILNKTTTTKAKNVSSITWDGTTLLPGSAGDYAGGVKEEDGIAFYFKSFVSEATDEIEFVLKEDNNTTKSYTVTGKAVITNPTTLKNVAVKYSSFTE